ncbi:MAG: hypothetical protein JRJ46_12950, partial [Deltaproteobacteria bacterium]|nr:hypothetical protein [Deltaproteobacteria bacterium]
MRPCKSKSGVPPDHDTHPKSFFWCWLFPVAVHGRRPCPTGFWKPWIGWRCLMPEKIQKHQTQVTATTRFWMRWTSSLRSRAAVLPLLITGSMATG